jgi:hypothetical protein
MGELLQLRADDLECREIDGEIVALDTRASTYFAVNGAGVTIWPALETGATRDELIGRLEDEFGIDHAVAAADVDAFVSMLRDQNLLR